MTAAPPCCLFFSSPFPTSDLASRSTGASSMEEPRTLKVLSLNCWCVSLVARCVCACSSHDAPSLRPAGDCGSSQIDAESVYKRSPSGSRHPRPRGTMSSRCRSCGSKTTLNSCRNTRNASGTTTRGSSTGSFSSVFVCLPRWRDGPSDFFVRESLRIDDEQWCDRIRFGVPVSTCDRELVHPAVQPQRFPAPFHRGRLLCREIDRWHLDHPRQPRQRRRRRRPS